MYRLPGRYQIINMINVTRNVPKPSVRKNSGTLSYFHSLKARDDPASNLAAVSGANLNSAMFLVEILEMAPPSANNSYQISAPPKVGGFAPAPVIFKGGEKKEGYGKGEG